MKIFLADLVHTWEKVSLWTFPLNVGFIGEYARKVLPFDVELRLFKRPELMIEAIKQEKPDVVALAHYVWNTNLNRLVFEITREHAPNALTVGGGPIFTKLNANPRKAKAFFGTTLCDAFVLNQGERGFAELIDRFNELGRNRKHLFKESIPGCLVNDLAGSGEVHFGTELDVLRNLDEIPSPYLSGLLDEFFDEPFVPMIETNRSCPYRCTFCAWGIGTGKLTTFSDERVLAEIDYIAQRCHKSANIFIGDANFGILERDQLIARRLRENHRKHGYPAHVGCQWNKTRPDRVLKVARELSELSEVGASMQSLDPDVLDAIKRKNLPLMEVKNLVEQLRSEGVPMPLFSELIVGLPNETFHSHIQDNKTLIDLGAEVFNYNLHLLPGTEMDTDESRERYFRRTGWRLHDNAFGIYEGRKVFEGQEVVLATNAMSEIELRSFRFIHFLLQLMWGRKWYYDYLHLMRHAGIHPVDMIVRVAEQFRSQKGEIGELYAKFRADHDLESFNSFDELASYWSDDEHMERLRSGGYGKLNYLFTYHIILDHYDAFNELLYETASSVVEELNIAERHSFLAQVRAVLDFSRELRIQLTDAYDKVVDGKRKSFAFDLLSWRQSGYQGVPAPMSTDGRYDYEFYLNDRQKTLLERQLSQFRSHNLNLTLRKMSEEIPAHEFFYHVRPAEG